VDMQAIGRQGVQWATLPGRHIAMFGRRKTDTNKR